MPKGDEVTSARLLQAKLSRNIAHHSIAARFDLFELIRGKSLQIVVIALIAVV